MTASTSPVLYLVVCAAPPARSIGELVTLLQARGWVVCVIATPRAAGWIDLAALADLTGHPVRHDHRHPDDPDVLPPADAVAVVPATFNTINKWVAGISDTVALGILNEAIGLALPILVVPHVKNSLAAHPVFDGNLATLAAWGAAVLTNEIIRPTGHDTGFAWQVVAEALPATA
jgi:phosphopantothenoylcysteine decarboxylase